METAMEMFVVYCVLFGGVTALAANARGRSAGAWFVIGLLFGVFGLVAVLVMKDESRGA
jgi:hypothetical protein